MCSDQSGSCSPPLSLFFFNDTATTEIYTLSLHDALPISVLTHCNAGALATGGIGTALAPIYLAHEAGRRVHVFVDETRPVLQGARLTAWELAQDRKSTRLNSSHDQISYAVFCLKKKKIRNHRESIHITTNPTECGMCYRPSSTHPAPTKLRARHTEKTEPPVRCKPRMLTSEQQ